MRETLQAGRGDDHPDHLAARAVDQPFDDHFPIRRRVGRSLQQMSMTETKSAASARDWALALAPYRRADMSRAVMELALTFPPFAALWTAMLIASQHGQVWLSFALAPLAAALLVRLFMIQ